jgi:molecular chaperone DnaK (HSP70)
MTHKLAIDFGTTNSVIARWNDEHATAEVLTIRDLCEDTLDGRPPIIPSLVYIHDGQVGQVTVGQAVRDKGLDRQKDNRLFRNFKRGIVAPPAPPPRKIDQVFWTDHDVGRSFLRHLVEALPYQLADLEQLVLTTPVASFENYLLWLNETLNNVSGEKIRIVDESTAAALGYMVTEPEAVVLVFDFGGGTLDLSLVQLPESREKTGGFLHRLLKLRSQAGKHTARIIAKAGQVIGGSDIDQWLLANVLNRVNLSPQEVGSNYTPLLTLCEQAKIVLSTAESTDLTFEVGHQSYTVTITRPELEVLLEENDFFTALRRVVDKVMYIARQRGIYREDIDYVLMVGGTSLMPSVQQTLKHYFTDMAVRSDKPFTAIAEGALQVALGAGLDDYLVHSYGLRHLDPQTGQHEYDEIIPMSSPYPTEKSVEVILGAAHPDQEAVEFVIGEIDSEAVAMVEVSYEEGQAVFVAQADHSARQIVPLNEAIADHSLAHLIPAGVPGEERLKASFTVDENRQLRVTVFDLKTGQELLQDAIVTALR